MNDFQNLIDRQLGFHYRFNYDNFLKRLVVNAEESFYGLLNANVVTSFEQDPPIFACRFSEAPGFGNILALANEDGRVAIQDTSTTNTSSSLHGFQCHNNAVFDLAWMPQHMSFVTVSGDHTASLWDVGESSPRRLLVFSSHTRSVKTAVFRPSEPSVFATGARDGHILVWDIRACNQPTLVLKPDNCLMNCHSSFTPKTPGSHGKRLRIENHRAISITGLVFQDDTTLISCGECDGNIKVWDLRKNYNVYKREPLPKHSIPYCGSSTRNGYTNLVIDDARIRLYASCMDNVIYCFNISTYNALPEQRYVGHENGTFYIKAALSPDGAHLVSGSSDKHAYVWSVRAPAPLVRLAGHRAEVTCAAWGAGPRPCLVTCGDDARHKLWRVALRPDAEVAGRAEAVPRADAGALAPRWGALDKTPNSLKRKSAATPGSCAAKRSRCSDTSARSTKRCLADLMNASRDAAAGAGAAAAAAEDEAPVKRLKLDSGPAEEEKFPPAGSKRRREVSDCGSPRKCVRDSTEPNDWNPVAEPGSSFVTPTKSYERRNCKILSPKSPKPCYGSPVKVSPTEVKVIKFTTPTKDLPNFVLNGEAPHLRLMSPVKKKQDTTDWLTLMVRERKGRVSEASDKSTMNIPSIDPKESTPLRRNSTSEKTSKCSIKKNRTLLTYFSIASKDK